VIQTSHFLRGRTKGKCKLRVVHTECIDLREVRGSNRRGEDSNLLGYDAAVDL